MTSEQLEIGMSRFQCWHSPAPEVVPCPRGRVLPQRVVHCCGSSNKSHNTEQFESWQCQETTVEIPEGYTETHRTFTLSLSLGSLLHFSFLCLIRNCILVSNPFSIVSVAIISCAMQQVLRKRCNSAWLSAHQNLSIADEF